MSSVSPREAVSQLRDAITSVRVACGSDPGCKALLGLLAGVEDELKEVSYSETQDRGPAPHEQLHRALSDAKTAADRLVGTGEPEEKEPPTNLRDANAETRRRFRQARSDKLREQYSPKG